ncbi:hypothetical protein, partial [Burkholderia sp. SIMBA_052]|uniref:hypothetical protein n=1 Tax=Burkholderia sp. SIMBA_052 TaxID=3085793 RepID=UPI00397DE9A0
GVRDRRERAQLIQIETSHHVPHPSNNPMDATTNSRFSEPWTMVRMSVNRRVAPFRHHPTCRAALILSDFRS